MLLIAGGVADAQVREPARGETVRERPRPDHDPLGIRAGSFLLFPFLEIGVRHDDNLYRVDHKENASRATSVRPGLKVESLWANHSVVLDAWTDIDSHQSGHDGEDSRDWLASGAIRLDVTRNTRLRASLGRRGLHEDRGAEHSAASRDPVTYDLREAHLTASHRWNRLGLTGEASFADFSFDDAVSAVTGAALVQSDRDRQERELAFRAAYEIAPEFEAFAQATLGQRRYRRPQGGYDRSSDGRELVVGTTLDFGGVVSGELFAGHLVQDYDDSRLADIGGPTVGASITWNVTPLTTIRTEVQRLVEETTVSASSGFLSTTIRASVDHELLRNLILDAGLGMTRNHYEGADREDTITRVGLGALWLARRTVQIEVDWRFEGRNSTVGGADYDDNVIGLRIRLQR